MQIITTHICREVMFLSLLCVCLSVCVSVSLSVSLSVCMSVRSVTFEADLIEILFLAQWYMSTISKSSLSTKVIGPRSRQAGG